MSNSILSIISPNKYRENFSSDLYGVYYEDNPVGLRTDVAISGEDLRLVTVVPNNTNKDLFHVRNGCLVENMSFKGSGGTTTTHHGLAAVAFPPIPQRSQKGECV